MTTRGRFTLWATLAGALAVLLAGVVAIGAVERSLEEVVDTRLDRVLDEAVDGDTTAEACVQVRQQAPASADAVVTVIDLRGRERCRSSAVAPSARALGVRVSASDGREIRRIDGNRWRVVTRTRTGAIVAAAELVEPGQAALRDARRAIWIAVGVGALLALAAGVFSSLPATRRIDDLLGGIERAGRDPSGELRVGRVGGRDLDRAAASFDALLDDLHELSAAQRRLVADAAHQLRTPITSIRTNAQLLERAPDLDEDTRDIATRIARQSAAVAGLVASLVDVAAMPAWARTADHDEVALATVVDAAVDAARGRWPGARIETELDDTHARVDAELVQRAVGNLLDNAVVHGTAPVRVTLERGCIAVSDHGEGFAAHADLREPFQPFATGPGGGTGLGLAFVDHVARAHGGEAVIASSAPPRVELRLPSTTPA